MLHKFGHLLFWASGGGNQPQGVTKTVSNLSVSASACNKYSMSRSCQFIFRYDMYSSNLCMQWWPIGGWLQREEAWVAWSACARNKKNLVADITTRAKVHESPLSASSNPSKCSDSFSNHETWKTKKKHMLASNSSVCRNQSRASNTENSDLFIFHGQTNSTIHRVHFLARNQTMGLQKKNLGKETDMNGHPQKNHTNRHERMHRAH